MNPIYLSTYFGFDLHDYKRIGDSILIASGSGLMMAIMDAVPRFKYCIDIDNHRNINQRVPNYLTALDLNCKFSIIAIAGWFSIDNPDMLQQGISKINNAQCITYSGGYKVFPNECISLNDLIDKCNANVPA
jgi:hypothetical protein